MLWTDGQTDRLVYVHKVISLYVRLSICLCVRMYRCSRRNSESWGGLPPPPDPPFASAFGDTDGRLRAVVRTHVWLACSAPVPCALGAASVPSALHPCPVASRIKKNSKIFPPTTVGTAKKTSKIFSPTTVRTAQTKRKRHFSAN